MKNIFKSKKFIIIILLIITAIGIFQVKDYIPRENQFVRTGNMTMPREGHKAVLLKDGRVLILGGATCKNEKWAGKISYICGGSTDTAELYNVKTRKFKLIGAMKTSHGDFSETLLKNGKVLIVGSYDRATPANAELFNPETNRFEITGSANKPRALSFTSTLLNDGNVLITGGSRGFDTVERAEIYNPQTGKFTLTGSLNIPRFGHASVLLKNGKVLIVGGENKVDSLSSVEIYDAETGKFTLTGNMNYKRKFPNAILLKDGNILISGGADNTEYIDNSEIFNPTRNTFTIVDGYKTTGRAATSTLLEDGNVLFIGGARGHDISLKRLNSTDIYNPKTNKFISGPKTKAPHSSHTATLMNDGRVLVTGGKKNLGIENKAEIYNYKK